MTEKTETPERPPAADGAAPNPDDPPAVSPLIIYGAEDDTLVCVDDTCVPAGAAR